MGATNELIVRIRETIHIGDTDYNSYSTTTFSNIKEISKRIATVPTSSEQEIVSFSTSIGSGTFVENDVRYLRITNMGAELSTDLSSSAEIRLTFKSTNAEEFAFKLPAGKSFIYNGRSVGDILGVSSSIAALGSALSSSVLEQPFSTISNITAQSSGSNCDLEYFVASI